MYPTPPRSSASTPTSESQPHPALRIAEKHFKSRAGRRLPSLVHLPTCCRPVLDLSRPGPSRCSMSLSSEKSAEAEDQGGVDDEKDEVYNAGWWGDGELGKRGRGKSKIVSGGVEVPLNLGVRPPVEWESQGVKNVQVAGRDAYVVTDGILLIPGYLDPPTQLSLLRNCLADYTRAPNPLSISIHYLVPLDLFGLYSSNQGSSLVAPRHSLLGDDERAAVAAATERGVRGNRIRVDTPPEAVGIEWAKGEEGSKAATGEAGVKEVGMEGSLMSLKAPEKTVDALLKEVRWANLGHIYDWTHKTYDFSSPSPRFPLELKHLCSQVVREVPWHSIISTPDTAAPTAPTSAGNQLQEYWTDYRPDTGIVNFYQLADTLMAHVDRSEIDPSRPLVSLSLGHAGLLLLGTASRDDPPIPIILRSGDALIMYGPGRRCYHGVPRILEGTLPKHFQPQAGDDSTMLAAKRWIETARINVNAREVFPPGHPGRDAVRFLD